MLACDLARAVLLVVIALLATDATPVWVLLALLLVAETFTAPFEAAHRAVVPDVLPDSRECLVGTGLLRVIYQVDQVLGIVAAGAVIVLVGERAGLLIDATSFLVSFVVLAVTLRWRPASRQAGDPTRRTLVGDFREGWRLVFDDPALRALVVLAWSAAVFLIAPEAVALAYARSDGAGPAVGAALMASLPAGAALGALLVARLEPVRQVRLIVPLAVGSCAPLLLTSLAPPWQVALPLWFLAGLSQGFMVPLMTTVNLITPAALRGRVNGLAGAGFSTVTAVTFLLAGAAADLASPAVAVTLAAVLGLALVGAAYHSWPAGALRRAAERVYVGG
jgi:MFS family permease